MQKTLRRLPTTNRNTALRFERNRAVLRRLAFYTVCGVILSGGFLFAAWQHAAATRYGYDLEQLRQQRAKIEDRQRQLQETRERMVSLSQLEINPLAAGLQAMQGSQIEMAQKGVRPLSHKAPNGPINTGRQQ